MKVIKSKDLTRYREEYTKLSHAESIAHRDYLDVLTDSIHLDDLEEARTKVENAKIAYHEAEGRLAGYTRFLVEKVLF